MSAAVSSVTTRSPTPEPGAVASCPPSFLSTPSGNREVAIRASSESSKSDEKEDALLLMYLKVSRGNDSRESSAVAALRKLESGVKGNATQLGALCLYPVFPSDIASDHPIQRLVAKTMLSLLPGSIASEQSYKGRNPSVTICFKGGLVSFTFEEQRHYVEQLAKTLNQWGYNCKISPENALKERSDFISSNSLEMPFDKGMEFLAKECRLYKPQIRTLLIDFAMPNLTFTKETWMRLVSRALNEENSDLLASFPDVQKMMGVYFDLCREEVIPSKPSGIFAFKIADAKDQFMEVDDTIPVSHESLKFHQDKFVKALNKCSDRPHLISSGNTLPDVHFNRLGLHIIFPNRFDYEFGEALTKKFSLKGYQCEWNELKESRAMQFRFYPQAFLFLNKELGLSVKHVAALVNRHLISDERIPVNRALAPLVTCGILHD
jgi:hypothetical protein